MITTNYESCWTGYEGQKGSYQIACTPLLAFAGGLGLSSSRISIHVDKGFSGVECYVAFDTQTNKFTKLTSSPSVVLPVRVVLIHMISGIPYIINGLILPYCMRCRVH